MAAMPLDLLNEILQRLTPDQVIGEYVSLKQAGKNFKGLCPFHAEKTPSFSVNPENGLWYCFGCGTGGNLIQFLMKIENLSFGEAKVKLAEKAGIVLDPAAEEEGKKQNRLRAALEKALAFYRQTLLNSHAGQEGLRYLQARGITPATMEKFQLGMAPPSGHALLRFLEQYDFTLDEARAAGLATPSDSPRDYFHRRLIFPIWNASGHIIGFGGRTMGDEQPKYLNSPDSAIFKKGENLYALHAARSVVAKEKFAILTEGYMDALMLHQYGFEQAVASLGTSFTPQQAKLLSRCAQRVVVSYDGDAAGIQAMQRAMGILQGAGLEMALISLPEGEDPDSLLVKQGADAFKSLLQSAASPVDYIFGSACRKYDQSTPEGKKRIVNEILPVLKSLHDPILIDGYVKKVSEKLDVSESSIRRLLRGGGGERAVESDFRRRSTREHELLRWLLAQPELAAMIWAELSPADFQDEETRPAAEALHRLWSEGKRSAGELDQLPDAVLVTLSRLSMEPPVGGIEAVQPMIEAQRSTNRKRDLDALKREVLARLKEGKLEPTDEAYTAYLDLLKSTKLKEEGPGA